MKTLRLRLLFIATIVLAIVLIGVVKKRSKEESVVKNSLLPSPEINKINTKGTEDQPVISLDGKRLCFLYSPMDFKLFQDSKGKNVKIIGPYRNGQSSDDVLNKKIWFKGYCSYKQDDDSWGKTELAPHELLPKKGGVYGKFMFAGSGEKIIAEAFDIKEINLGGNGDLVYFEKQQDGKLKGPFILSPYFNTKYMEQDFHITLNGKTIIFRSDNPESLGFGDIFISHLENGVWNKPENIGAPINTKDGFEAPGWLSPDEQRIYFIRRYPQPRNVKKSGIYFSEQINGKWQEPIKLELWVDGHDVFAPTLTQDEKTLYFEYLDKATNNYDIYMSYKNDAGAWSAAKVL